MRDRLAAALGKCGYEVVDPGAPIRVHSHCAGMDAVAWSIKNLGISARALVTESDPAAAAFHMVHHSKTEHIIADIKWVAEGTSGPCFKHGGKMCAWGTRCDLLFSSFVCKPYSQQNSSKRLKTMTEDVGSDPHGVDTYHHTKAAIARYRPRAFVLENVSGVATSHSEEPRSKKSKHTTSSPADFMLGDLQSAGYEVMMLPSVKASEVAKMCQSRPRALFFGVRRGESIQLDSVIRLFKSLGHEYAALGDVDKIDDFLDAGACGVAAAGADADKIDDFLEAGSADAEFDYLVEYTKVRGILLRKFPEEGKKVPLPTLGSKTDRFSDSVPAESARIRATIDAVAKMYAMHTPACLRSPDCSCHPLADISQRADRVSWRVDGSIHTLTTRSRIFSYKMRRFIAPPELALSMGYGRKCSLAPFSPTVAQTLVGNGYCVPVCALAVAAAASVVGIVAPKIKKDSSA